MVLGFANGAFDGLHDGHKHFLRECMMNCGRLVVALNSDLSVKRRKGEDRPKLPLLDRAAEVQSFLREKGPGRADSIAWFETEGELADMIKSLKPDVLFKGEDYLGKAVTGATLVGRVHWIARHPGYTTTGKDWP